jgi:hypothetical protein
VDPAYIACGFYSATLTVIIAIVSLKCLAHSIHCISDSNHEISWCCLNFSGTSVSDTSVDPAYSLHGGHLSPPRVLQFGKTRKLSVNQINPRKYVPFIFVLDTMLLSCWITFDTSCSINSSLGLCLYHLAVSNSFKNVNSSILTQDRCWNLCTSFHVLFPSYAFLPILTVIPLSWLQFYLHVHTFLANF